MNDKKKEKKTPPADKKNAQSKQPADKQNDKKKARQAEADKNDAEK